MSKSTQCFVCVKRPQTCCERCHFGDEIGVLDVSNTNADWAFSGWEFWQMKKGHVLHYLSISAFSHSKYFFDFRHWGNSERILWMLFHFKTFDAPLAAHSEMSCKEKKLPFKLPENFFFLFSFVSFVSSWSLCPGLLLFWLPDAVKMLYALVNVRRCSDRP